MIALATEMRSWRSEQSKMGVLSAGSQSASYQRSQHKARFIQQGKVRMPLNGLMKHAGPFLGDPPFHLLVVALAGAFLRFLTGPVQTLFQQLTYMLRVILDAKVSFDQDRHPPRGPQLIGPTVCHRPLAEQGSQLAQLRVRHAARTTRGRFGTQTTPMASQPSPPMDRSTGDPQNPGHDRGRLTLFDQRHGPHSPSLQIFWAPSRSHPAIPYMPRSSGQLVTLLMLDSVAWYQSANQGHLWSAKSNYVMQIYVYGTVTTQL